ncbi:tRNA-specific 2-thiouridylase MnmA [Gracilariopsis chorda]|uniref:tRNA-5-taurinomethyluridine 2-sulfurtransferase n=1 Tax=Gracilariopsis chorda TaxID=448386 RepID=A0A2V3IUQ5_9FLOR|nr:tRNA-specific 2-thiouridylase MnmA [Gracilariopsis chorda]|eukprot:PXF45853.1 tRNA-specific 2-thiouridylase MnmA [Gracilariopsis chorda]
MKSMREESLSPSSRVPGCTSVTHLIVKLNQDNCIEIEGYSDARISRGLLALFVIGLHRCSTEDALKVDASELLAATALPETIGSSRITGLASILRELQKRVRALESSKTTLLGCNDQDLAGRWSDRQGEDVAVLLSGGVDSSVAMRLIMESGARPHPFYIKIWLDDEMAHMGECPWEEDIEYASAVCRQAGVKLQDVPFQRAYWDEVVSYTVEEARRGRTPNPDIMCNSRIKFGAFYNRIGKHFDRIVTGHYAQAIRDLNGRVELRTSPDVMKDQTYFLAHLKQEQLKTVCFPVGRYTKEKVRQFAQHYDLPNQNRRDSQGICFLGKLKFDEFLGHHLGYRKGSLVEFETGKELGYHNGFWFFTLGQRRGVGLSGGPWYVVAKDVSQNVVYVSKDYNGVSKERNRFEFDKALWISGRWPPGLQASGDNLKLRVKTRHGPSFHNAIVTRLDDERGLVELEERDKGLAAGQFSAFYDYEGRCLGSGTISCDISILDLPREIQRLTSDSVRLQAHVC